MCAASLFNCLMRLRRRDYAIAQLCLLSGTFFWALVHSDIGKVAGFAAGVGNLAFVVPRRLHDLDRPAWHTVLVLVPFYNLYLGFQLLFLRGTIGANHFGPDPVPGTALTRNALPNVAHAPTVASPQGACPRCATRNEPAARFCRRCGDPLSLQCSSCLTANAVDSGFCTACGAAFGRAHAV
jgi:uncharacterized membrane protein YhaH (DUF805 family)